MYSYFYNYKLIVKTNKLEQLYFKRVIVPVYNYYSTNYLFKVKKISIEVDKSSFFFNHKTTSKDSHEKNSRCI